METLTDPQRRRKLNELQAHMQRIWDRIERLELQQESGCFVYSVELDRIAAKIKRLWIDYGVLECQESELLIPGRLVALDDAGNTEDDYDD